jgi:uncharacterized protein YukE
MVTYAMFYSEVEDALTQMGTLAQAIQNTLDELENGTTQHLSEWTSAARNAYNERKAIWDRAAADMAAQAVVAQNSLGQILEAYRWAENQSSSMLGG